MSVEDERSTWTPHQERWRGTVEATMQGMENRHRENIESFDKRLRDYAESRERHRTEVAQKFTEVWKVMTDMGNDADAQQNRTDAKIDSLRDAMKKETDDLRMRLTGSESAILDRIAKSDSRVGVIVAVGGIAATVGMALFQWFLGTIK